MASLYTFSLLTTLTFTFPNHILSLINANFDPELSLAGDARIAGNGSHVQLTRPFPQSSGLIKCNNPIKFLDANSTSVASFSTDFTFSISKERGDGIALVFAPNESVSGFGGNPFGIWREKRFLAVEFDTLMNENVGDVNGNHVGIDVDGFDSVEFEDVGGVGLVLNSGEKLRAWIDYDASSKRLEVRLGKFGDRRPYVPLLARKVDFSTMWGNEDVFVGISSRNGGDSTQSSDVFSWRFGVRKIPNWMHSFPVNPHGSNVRHNNKKGSCFLNVLEGVIFATGCGALIAFVMLFMWSIFVSRDSVFPVDCLGKPGCLGQSGEFGYQKIDVVVEKDAGSVKN